MKAKIKKMSYYPVTLTKGIYLLDYLIQVLPEK